VGAGGGELASEGGASSGGETLPIEESGDGIEIGGKKRKERDSADDEDDDGGGGMEE
jgi:hypothetical protein